VNEYPAVPDYRSELAVTLHALADIHLRRGEPADARSLLDQAVQSQLAALALNSNYRPFRLRLFQTYEVLAKTLIELKSLDDAAKLAEELVRTDPGRGQGHFAAAAVFARCATLAVEESHYLTRVYADRSVELLKDAIRLGYCNPERLTEEKDFDSIRGRPDFQELVRNHIDKPGG
jgi:tetratricopeptide (TPR) repeat protein